MSLEEKSSDIETEAWSEAQEAELQNIFARLPKNPKTGLPIHRAGENDEDVRRYGELLRLKHAAEQK